MSHAWSASGTLRGFRPCTAMMLQVNQQIGQYLRIGEKFTQPELVPQPYNLVHIVVVEAIIKLAGGHDSRCKSIHHDIYIDGRQNRRSNFY